jgi:hypothetical protein
MVRVKCRWLLPLGHVLIDCILLVALIVYSNRISRREKSAVHPPGPIQAALLLQEDLSVEWDPRTSAPPGPFMLIMSGNLPAGLISGILRPEAGIVNRRQPWDRVWFLLPEAVAFLCWYLIGLWIDAGRSRLGKVMIAYLVVRCLLALAGVYDIGWRIQILFWMGFTVWLAGFGSSRLIRVGLRSARRA